ncbi:hypothetical protein B0H14DRAFT_3906149 [Mycena olivaceomarginata]|nr:hypothetical protein B0H14DRAFT_3906149 [Mycena olivaceomarginata]
MNVAQGVDYGTKVPTEVWSRCWSIASPHDLRRLVLVCQYFRDICQPFLFHHQRFMAPDPQEIDRTNWIPTVRDLHRSTVRLKKLAGGHHVSSVRSWHFRGNLEFPDLVETYRLITNIGMVEETYMNLVQTFSGTLSLYRNLSSLRLGYFTIDAPFREALSSLERLDELQLDSCDIMARRGGLLSLHKFTLARFASDRGHDHCDQPLEIVSPATLHTLSIDNSRDSRALLFTLADESITFPNLVSVSVELFDATAKTFLAFLASCPYLTQLRITKSFLSGPIRDRLAATTIPLLRVFNGPRLLAAPFISDRPVSVIDLAGGSGFEDENKPMKKDIIRDLIDIAHSSVAVHSLSLCASLPIAIELCAAIAIHFPDLRELALGLREPPPVREFRPASTDDSDLSELETSDMEVEVDDRTVELPDNCSLDSLSSFGGSPNIILSEDSACEGGIPDVLLPGHMYTTSGRIFPPPPQQPASPAAAPKSLASFINCICSGLISLPAPLVSLRLAKQSSWHALRRRPITREDERRALLALAQQLPGLREVDFEVNGWWWERRRDNTWTQKYVFSCGVPGLLLSS